MNTEAFPDTSHSRQPLVLEVRAEGEGGDEERRGVKERGGGWWSRRKEWMGEGKRERA